MEDSNPFSDLPFDPQWPVEYLEPPYRVRSIRAAMIDAGRPPCFLRGHGWAKYVPLTPGFSADATSMRLVSCPACEELPYLSGIRESWPSLAYSANTARTEALAEVLQLPEKFYVSRESERAFNSLKLPDQERREDWELPSAGDGMLDGWRTSWNLGMVEAFLDLVEEVGRPCFGRLTADARKTIAELRTETSPEFWRKRAALKAVRPMFHGLDLRKYQQDILAQMDVMSWGQLALRQRVILGDI